jgi:hypothetical protein
MRDGTSESCGISSDSEGRLERPMIRQSKRQAMDGRKEGNGDREVNKRTDFWR